MRLRLSLVNIFICFSVCVYAGYARADESIHDKLKAALNGDNAPQTAPLSDQYSSGSGPKDIVNPQISEKDRIYQSKQLELNTQEKLDMKQVYDEQDKISSRIISSKVPHYLLEKEKELRGEIAQQDLGQAERLEAYKQYALIEEQKAGYVRQEMFVIDKKLYSSIQEISQKYQAKRAQLRQEYQE